MSPSPASSRAGCAPGTGDAGATCPGAARAIRTHVLVSELMLQQTQVARVVDFYDRFLRRFPTLDTWPARRGAPCARPGTGSATTRVRATCIALARTRVPCAMVGSAAGTSRPVAHAARHWRLHRRRGRVVRVREAGRRSWTPTSPACCDGSSRRDSIPARRAARDHLWGLAESVLPRTGRATWTHNQALMELGALVCTARVMHCARCPVARLCATAPKAALKAPARR